MATLKIIKEELNKCLSISDPWALDLIFATILGNTFLKGRLWLLLIGSSGAGKTSLVDPTAVLPSIFFLDDLSPQSLLSGYGGGNHSLLDIITLDKKTKKRSQKTIVFSDFTTILSKNQEQRGEILAQLRVVYDGKMSKGTGVGLFKWEGRIGVLACSTPAVYNHLEAGRAMGERFLYYVMANDQAEEQLTRQDTAQVFPEEITERLKPLYYEYCFDIKEYIQKNGLPEMKLTPEQTDRLHKAAIFCAKSKTDVRLDYKSGKVASMPQTAAPTRDYRAFRTLLHMVHTMDCYEVNDHALPVSDSRIKLIEKCAYSAIATERRKILEALAFSDKELTSAELSDSAHGLGLPPEAIEKFIAPLHAVGLINKTVKGNGSKSWSIRDSGTRDFIRNVSATLREEGVRNLDIFEAGASEQENFNENF